MGDWGFLARLMITFGLIMLALGLLVLGLGKLFQIGRLPGDIIYQRGNFTFYFPVVTSIVLSLILTVVLNILLRR